MILLPYMSWNEVFNELKQKDYFKKLEAFWDEEYSNHVVYPSRENIFNAFKLTPLEEVKVVIFGQDPYHEPGQAMGVAFSVPTGVKLPPSLVNIYKEIEIEYGTRRTDGDLTYLAKQGVLLLNTVLTVREHEPLSHNNNLYKSLLLDIIKVLNDLDQPIVFMLWGGNAQKLEKYLTNPKHKIIKNTHPSPLGANKGGWFNCNQFRICSEFLSKNGKKEINWLQ